MSLADVQAMKALKKIKDIAQNQITANLFNPNDVNFLNGYQLNLNSPIIQNASYFTSGYIPVDMNSQYIFYHVRNYCYYDENYNYLGGENLNGSKANAVLSVFEFSNTKYVRFSTNITNLTGAYVYKVPIQQRSKLFGKMIVGIGDSLTSQGYWQPYIKRNLGAFINTYGVGGTQITDLTGSDTTAMSNDARINVMQSWGDYIILFGGTNDWGHNVPMGSIRDTINNTFYGACKTMAQKLTTKYPTSKIIFVAPPYSLQPNKPGWGDVSGFTNNSGYSIGDYGSAMKEVARINGIPFVDLLENCGWNSVNIANYMIADTNAYVHPTNGEGAERCAISIINCLKSLASLA